MRITLSDRQPDNQTCPQTYDVSSELCGVETIHTVVDLLCSYNNTNPDCLFSSYQRVHELDETLQMSLKSSFHVNNSSIIKNSLERINKDLFYLIESCDRLQPEEQSFDSMDEPSFEPAFEPCSPDTLSRLQK